MIGKTISHYEIGRKLGEGGMGAVYLAQDMKLKRQVAIKFFISKPNVQEEEKIRFVQEAQAAARLDHPNICTVHEIGEEDGHNYIVMSYVDGPTLKDKLKEVSLSINDVLRIAIESASGFKEAHDAGIIHRDIKSSNIMLTGKGLVKVMDFGVAKLLEGPDLTRHGSTLGTLSYMSPEQVNGKKIDVRTDIWSLGVLIYEMVTGTHPFRGRQYEVMRAIVSDDPLPCREYNSLVPPKLELIVNKCLEKEPDDRYQNMAELIADLEDISNWFAKNEYRPPDSDASRTMLINEHQQRPPEPSAPHTAPVFPESSGKKWLVPVVIFLLAAAGITWYLTGGAGADESAPIELIAHADSARSEMLLTKQEALTAGAASQPEFRLAATRELKADSQYNAHRYQDAGTTFASARDYYEAAINGASTDEQQLQRRVANLKRNAEKARGKVSSSLRKNRNYTRGQTLESRAQEDLASGSLIAAESGFQQALQLYESLHGIQTQTKTTRPRSVDNTARRTADASRTRMRDSKTAAISADATSTSFYREAEKKSSEGDSRYAAKSYVSARNSFEDARHLYNSAVENARQNDKVEKPAEPTANKAQRDEALLLWGSVNGKFDQLDDSYSYIRAYREGKSKRDTGKGYFDGGDFAQAIETFKSAEKLHDQAVQTRRSDERAIQRLIDEYRTALQSKSSRRLKQVYPGISKKDETNWKNFFKAAENLRVNLKPGKVAFSEQSASTRVAAELNFSLRGRDSQQASDWAMEFSRSGGDWKLSSVE